jgi:hypothetical protein
MEKVSGANNRFVPAHADFLAVDAINKVVTETLSPLFFVENESSRSPWGCAVGTIPFQ